MVTLKLVKIELSGKNLTKDDFVRGKRVSLDYQAPPKVAARLGIRGKGKTEFVIDRATPAKLGDLFLLSGHFPDLAVRGSGGFVIQSQKGWLLTHAGPRTEH